MGVAKRWAVFVVAICASFSLVPGAGAGALDYWRIVFNANDPGLADSNVYSTDSGKLAWGESYQLESYVVMYRATLNRKYLKEAARNIDIELTTAANNRWQWTTATYSIDQTTQYPYTVHDGMILTPIAEFVRIVEADQPNLSPFKQSADKYLRILEKHFAHKWDAQWIQLDDGRGFFVLPEWDTQYAGLHPGISLPYNQSEAFGRFLFKLFLITGNTSYRDKAVAIATTLKSAISMKEDCCYVWPYAGDLLSTDGPRYTAVSDTSHANIDIGFVQDLVDQGVVFDQSDLERIAATFLRYVYDPAAVQVHQYMDGTGELNVHGFNNNFTHWSGLTARSAPLGAAMSALFANPAVNMVGPTYQLAVAYMALSQRALADNP